MAKHSLFTVVILSLSSLSVSVCTGPGQNIGGYTYCQAVNRAVIDKIGTSGTYNEAVAMDSKTGKIDTIPHSYSGPLAPFNEDLSIQLRGPMNLKRLAVFMPGAAKKQKRDFADIEARRVRYSTVVQEVDVYEKVVIDTSACGGEAKTHTEFSTVTRRHGKPTGTKNPHVGSIVPTAKGQFAEVKSKSTLSTSTKETAPTPATESTCAATCTSTVTVKGPRPSAQSSEPAPTPSSSVDTGASQQPSNGAWSRTAYYNADSKSTEGLVFLNNRGGQGSGVWDSKFGNSLSYADSVKDTGAAAPQVFGGFLPQGTQELSVFSDTKCTEALCGFSRPGAPAYYGFAGASKLFLMEFNMPAATNPSLTNLPAIWMLNGHIDRVGQYVAGNCQPSGCGELDIFEVLEGIDGSHLIPTVHANAAGGFSDFFVRPVDAYMKAAILMHNDTIIIQVLPSTFDMDSSTVSHAQIDQLMSNDQWTSSKVSVLKLQS